MHQLSSSDAGVVGRDVGRARTRLKVGLPGQREGRWLVYPEQAWRTGGARPGSYT